MKAAKLSDVARAAGVSTSLVSVVLSGKGANRCSPETEARIREVAQQLGYRANRLARSLKEQHARTIGLLSIEVATTPYAGEMLMAAQRTARSHDYDLFFVEVENNAESIENALELMAEHRVGGVLIAAFFHCEIQMPTNVPENLIFANCFGKGLSNPSYVPAEYPSFMQALKLLGIAGHKNVAFLTEEHPWPAAVARAKAFRDAANAFGWIKPDDRIYAYDHTEPKDGYLGTLEMMMRDPEITAIACYNDRLAMGAYQALSELGISIPDQVSITGFDDMELISAGLHPGLTTVRLPHYQMGRDAVEHLIQLCEERAEVTQEKIEIRGELVVRDSVTGPRASTSLPADPGVSKSTKEKEEK